MIRRRVLGVTRILFAALSLFVVIDSVRANAAASGSSGVATFLSSLTAEINLVTVACFALGAVFAFRRPRDTRGFTLFRAVDTSFLVTLMLTYLVIYGPQTIAAGTFFAWENLTLHVFVPVYGIIDWLVAPVENRLAFSRVWVALVFPVVWFAYTYLRGYVTGSFVYEFLNPALSGGYGPSLLATLCILLGFLLAAIAVIAFDRAVTGDRFDRRS